MMTTRQRYKMGYLGYLRETASDLLDKKVLADMVYGLLCLMLIISMPISIPVVAVMRMVVTKRNMRKQYGHNELMGD